MLWRQIPFTNVRKCVHSVYLAVCSGGRSLFECVYSGYIPMNVYVRRYVVRMGMVCLLDAHVHTTRRVRRRRAMIYYA